MILGTKKYLEQKELWPKSGKHILAQYTEDTVVVYQAYRPAIGLFAMEKQYFGGEFSYTRMSWIKPNFLWMMYRSGWGEKQGQEITLAIHLKRNFFDNILLNAYPSKNIGGIPTKDWARKIKTTDVRLQWDPDHGPRGQPLSRKAIQLGLRNKYLLPFKGEGIHKIENISTFVSEQRAILKTSELDDLVVPEENVYEVSPEIRKVLFMD